MPPQQRGDFEDPQLPTVPTEMMGQTDGDECHTTRMPHRGDIAVMQPPEQTSQHRLADHAIERQFDRTVR